MSVLSRNLSFFILFCFFFRLFVVVVVFSFNYYENKKSKNWRTIPSNVVNLWGPWLVQRLGKEVVGLELRSKEPAARRNTKLTDSCEHWPYECFCEGRFLSHVRIYTYTISELQHREDLWYFSEKNLAEVEREVEVKDWIGGTTGETGFHSILFLRFYPRGDPGPIPVGSLVQISSPASREWSRYVSRGNFGGNLRKYRRKLQRIRTSRNSSFLSYNQPFHSFTNLRRRYNRATVFNP